jgi:hypothetical protein
MNTLVQKKDRKHFVISNNLYEFHPTRKNTNTHHPS